MPRTAAPRTSSPRRAERAPSRRRSRQLENALAQLAHVELVKPLDDAERAYAFRHLLIQDTARATLLRGESRRLNHLVAQALERLYPDQLDEYAAVLAQHYAEAEDDAKTLEYSTRAGDQARRKFANEEGLAHYARALEAATRSGASSEQIIHLYTERGRILEVIGRFYDALASYRELDLLAQARNDPALHLAALVLCGTLHSAPLPTFDPPRANELLLEALGMSRELGDEPTEARILWNLCLLYAHTARPADAVTYGEESLAIAQRLNLTRQIAYSLHDLVTPYIGTGQVARAREVQLQSRELFRAMDDKPLLADSLGMGAQFALLQGELELSHRYAAEGAEIGASIGNLFGVAFNDSFMVACQIERGEFADALRLSAEIVETLERNGLVIQTSFIRGFLAVLLGELGAFDRAAEHERRVHENLTTNTPMPGHLHRGVLAVLARSAVLRGDLEAAQQDLPFSHAELVHMPMDGTSAVYAPLAASELALAHGDAAGALEILGHLLEQMRRLEAHLITSQVLYLQARAFALLDSPDPAMGHLREAEHLARAIGMQRFLWHVLALRGNLEARRGNSAEANRYRDEARAVIAYLAARTPDDLRETFLRTAHRGLDRKDLP